MNDAMTIVAIGAAIGVGAISPGPSFVMIARTAMGSRANGLVAALGMGIGGSLFALLSLLGLQAMLAAVPWLYLVIRIAGGTYLMYLGYRIWKGADAPLLLPSEAHPSSGSSRTRALLLGLGTQLSNPKTAMVYGSIFASLLPHEVPVAMLIVLPPLVFVIETGWYAIVTLLLSSAAPRAGYLRYKPRIDRVAGGVMAALGIRLIASAVDGGK